MEARGRAWQAMIAAPMMRYAAQWGRNSRDMSNVINLRQARKAKSRDDKARAADGNRAKFGRTKAERIADEKDQARQDALLDGAYREGRGLDD